MDPNIIHSSRPYIETVEGVTLPELLRTITLKQGWGNSIAFESFETGVKYRHQEVLDISRAFAAGLENLRLMRSDVVTIALPNCPEYAPILYGIWDAGGICSPINSTLTLDEMKRNLQHSQTKYVVTTPELVSRFQKIKECVPVLKSLKIISLDEALHADSNNGVYSFFELIKTDTSDHEFVTGSDMDTTQEVALYAYSSGTTGLPKAVMHTHANLCTSLLQHIQPGAILMNKTGNPISDAERQIGLLPFCHIMGMIYSCFVTMATGAHTLTISKYSPATFVDAIRLHRPTILHMVTPLIAMMANSPEITIEDFKSIKTVIFGAAPIGSGLIRRFLSKAGKPIAFQEGYGMTEMMLFSLLNPHVLKNKTGSIGTMVASTEAKIMAIDGTGKSLSANQVGELCVKGPQVMKGYLHDSDATSEVIDGDGWLHTGDLCYYDADGCFYVVDRLKELIKVKGMQVAPAELENVLRAHPLILDAAVIGIPHDEFVELPRAYIVRKSDKLLEEDVHQYMKPELAHYKQLKGGIRFVKFIPKSPAGKILRRVLRDQYQIEVQLERNCNSDIICDVGKEQDSQQQIISKY